MVSHKISYAYPGERERPRPPAGNSTTRRGSQSVTSVSPTQSGLDLGRSFPIDLSFGPEGERKQEPITALLCSILHLLSTYYLLSTVRRMDVQREESSLYFLRVGFQFFLFSLSWRICSVDTQPR